MRIRSWSTQPPKNPATRPAIVPTMVEMQRDGEADLQRDLAGVDHAGELVAARARRCRTSARSLGGGRSEQQVLVVRLVRHPATAAPKQSDDQEHEHDQPEHGQLVAEEAAPEQLPLASGPAGSARTSSRRPRRPPPARGRARRPTLRGADPVAGRARSASTLGSRHDEPDPRVEHAVEHVGEQVEEDHEDRDDDHPRHEHGDVADLQARRRTAGPCPGIEKIVSVMMRPPKSSADVDAPSR